MTHSTERPEVVRAPDRQIPVLRRLLCVALPFTSAYLLSELFRNVNAVLAPVLRTEFHLASTTMGFMTAAFLGALAGSQLFVGQALDRFGPKRVLVATLSLAALASILFALAQNPATLVLGRFLIGLGLCACWTGAYKANALWWPRERLPLVNALTIGVAGLGSLAATAPAEWLLGRIDWREMFFGLAAVASWIALWIACAVPPAPTAAPDPGKFAGSRIGLRTIVAHPAFLCIMPVSALCQGAWIAYQGLWAGVWLREAIGLPPDAAAGALMALALAVIVGQCLFGLLADRLAQSDKALFHLTFTLTAFFILTQIAICAAPGTGQNLLWVCYGLFTAGPILAYALLVRLLPQSVSGRAISLLNLGAVLSGFIFQGGIGAAIDILLASGQDPATAQRGVLFGIVLCQAVALANMWLRRDRAIIPTGQTHA